MSIVALVNDYCRLVRVGVLLGCEMLRVFLDFLTDCFPLSSQAVSIEQNVDAWCHRLTGK